MGVVNITYLESGAVTGKTTRTQGRQTALMCQLRQRVVLVHELGKLGASEKLLHCGSHRLDIDQGLRGNALQILSRHTLAYDTLHTGKTDAVLVLQQFAHGTDTTIAQMVDIVGISHAIFQMHVVVNGSQNIFLRNMHGDQLMHIFLNGSFYIINIIVLVQNGFQHRIVNQLGDAQISRVAIHVSRQIHGHIGQDLHLAAFLTGNKNRRNGGVLDSYGQLLCNDSAGFGQDFAGVCIHHVFCQREILDTILKCQLFIKLVTSNLRQVISSRIEEHGVDQRLSALHGKRLARTYFLI